MEIIDQLFKISKEYGTDLMEEIAVLLFYTDGSLDMISDEDFGDVIGGKRERWEDAPEWKRDDYRHQAKMVLKYFKMKVFGEK